jgi:hypothetical protein
MATIQIAPARRIEFFDLERRWTANLPRKPGQIGGQITGTVEGPVGTFLNLNKDFLDFLRQEDFPFVEIK